MPPICPQCGKDNHIQKVSHIYSSGTGNSSLSGWAGDGAFYADGKSQTLLARQLEPPRIRQSTHWFWFLIPWVFIPGFSHFLMLLAPIGKLSKFVLLAIAGVCLAIYTEKLKLGENTTAALVVLVCIVIPVIYYIALIRMAQIRSKKSFQSWQQSKAQWDQLYYCSRDSSVFLPGTGISVPAERIGELINQPYISVPGTSYQALHPPA